MTWNQWIRLDRVASTVTTSDTTLTYHESNIMRVTLTWRHMARQAGMTSVSSTCSVHIGAYSEQRKNLSRREQPMWTRGMNSCTWHTCTNITTPLFHFHNVIRQPPLAAVLDADLNKMFPFILIDASCFAVMTYDKEMKHVAALQSQSDRRCDVQGHSPIASLSKCDFFVQLCSS